MLTPVLEQETSAKGITLAKIDVDSNPRTAGEFGISGIPAVKAFVDGKVAAEFVGAQPPANVKAFLDALPTKKKAEPPKPKVDTAQKEAELKRLLDQAVAATTTEPRLEARNAMQAIFDELGPDHPLTKTYRRKLADELY
jgi:putative thioredoxin